MVRAELMEQVPHLAMYCQENSFMFTNPISTYILPTVVKYLIDSNNQVQVLLMKYKAERHERLSRY